MLDLLDCQGTYADYALILVQNALSEVLIMPYSGVQTLDLPRKEHGIKYGKIPCVFQQTAGLLPCTSRVLNPV